MSKESWKVNYALITADDDLNGGDDGGAAPHETARDFFVRVRNQSKMAMNSRLVPMRGTGTEIPMLNFSGRLLEADTNQTSRKRGVDTEPITLSGKRVKAAINVARSFLEENIEGERGLATMVDALAAGFANGLEEMLFNANTLGGAILQSDFNNDRDDVGVTTQYVRDDLYKLFNGMIQQAVQYGHAVNGANTTDLRKMVTMALKALPAKYREDAVFPGLRLFMPADLVLNLRYIVGERRTPLGDVAVTQNNQLTIAGIPVVALPLLSNSPKYVQRITFGATTVAKSLDFAYIDEDTVIVTPTTMTTSPVSAATLTTDYTVHETNGTITPVSGTVANSIRDVTYNIPPLFILTHQNNIVWGLNENFRFGEFEDVDKDTHLVVIRTRIDFKYQETDGVVYVKNIQDALPSSAPL